LLRVKLFAQPKKCIGTSHPKTVLETSTNTQFTTKIR
jgi:hypothetical protein